MSEEATDTAAIFLAALPEARRAEARAWPGLARALEEIAATARAAWPGVLLDDGSFVAHVAARLPVEGGDLPGALARARTADLFLACACGRGDPSALASFESRYFVELDAAWRRFDYVSANPDDVRQILRQRLFLAAPERAPRILEYAGEGDLRNWVRAIVLRTLLNLASRESREVPAVEADLLALAGDVESPESTLFKEKYGAEMKLAFAQAVEELSFRERNVLRYACVDGLSIDGIGEVYGVHRATAARWLARAKEELANHLRAALTARLGVSDSELASILRLTMSGVELSLARHLGVPWKKQGKDGR
jgi:RNA polymerase sigma-70 factor (ECF subfamily)